MPSYIDLIDRKQALKDLSRGLECELNNPSAVESQLYVTSIKDYSEGLRRGFNIASTIIRQQPVPKITTCSKIFSLDSSITESLRDSINSSESTSDSTGYQPKKSSEEIPPSPDTDTTVQSPPRRVKIAFKTAKIDNSGKSGKWLINCDGYYPYCNLCGYEPEWTGKDNRTPKCPRCKATMSKDDFDEKKFTVIDSPSRKEWKVIVDRQSARFICPSCKFEHVEADPCAQIEWQGCPQCLTPLKVPDVRTRLLNNIYDK